MSEAAYLPSDSLLTPASALPDARKREGRTPVLGWALALALGGYGLVSFLPGLFDREGREFTVPFRALVLLASVICLIVQRNRFLASNGLRFFLAFWTIYTGRFLFDTVLNPIPLALPLADYWLNAFGIGFIPALAFCISTKPEDLAFVRRFLMIAWAVVSALSLAFGDWSLGGSGRLSGNQYLNPITNGHIAAGLLLLCVHYLFGKQKSMTGMVFALCSIPLGLFTLLAANSRGPVVCAAVTAGVLVLVGIRGRTRLAVLLLALLVYLALPSFVGKLEDQGEGSTIATRMGKLGDESSIKDESRYLTYAAAWLGYIENPILGYRFELPTSVVDSGEGAYPHNLILETLMSTGTVGGILMFGLIASTVRSAWRLLRDQQPNNWISLIFVQYLAGAMFSGGIFNDSELWHCSMAVATLDAFFRRPSTKQS